MQQNLWVAAYQAEHDRRAADRKVAAVLTTIGLAARTKLRAGELSHGQQQWLDIGMVLCMSPAVIMLDEPAAGMTAVDGVLASMIRELASSAAVIVVEHDMDFA